MENREEKNSGPQPKEINRRKFLKLGLGLGVVAAGTAAAAKIGFGLNKGKNENIDEGDRIPTYSNVVDAVNHAYRSAGRKIPDKIKERLDSCNENNVSSGDIVRTVLHSCGQVGGGINDLIGSEKNNDTRNNLISDLKTVETYTYGKIDEYATQGRLPDPQNIDSFKQQFKEIYFTVSPK